MNTPFFEDYLKQYLREVTAKTFVKRLRILAKLGDLDDTNRMKTLICTYTCTESFKELLANIYDYYVKYRGLSWIEPRSKRENKPIFVPLENELDQLISKATFKMSVFLQLLKETRADSGEE